MKSLLVQVESAAMPEGTPDLDMERHARMLCGRRARGRGEAVVRAVGGHASISGPEKGGGPTESQTFRDAGGAGPLGGRPFPPLCERRRGASRVRAAVSGVHPWRR